MVTSLILHHNLCAEFHPRMIGLTGTPEACSVAARAFRVYHHKTNETKDYLVDHSIITYLLGTPLRAGQCAHCFPQLLLWWLPSLMAATY